MVGPRLQPAQAKLVQPIADGAFVHRHAEAPHDLLAQVKASPADHPLRGQSGPARTSVRNSFFYSAVKAGWAPGLCRDFRLSIPPSL